MYNILTDIGDVFIIGGERTGNVTFPQGGDYKL